MDSDLRDELIVRAIVFGAIFAIWHIAAFEEFVFLMLLFIYERVALGG